MRTTTALVLVLGCVHRPPTGHATARPDSPQSRRVAIVVTKEGFDPDTIDVHRGETVTLVFTRTVKHTCVKRVLVSLDDDHDVQRDLAMNQPVPITLHFDRPGELIYQCSMGMRGGTIRVMGP